MNQAFKEENQNSSAKPEGTRSRSRTSQTYTAMREDIIMGLLKPGLKLKIEDLTQRYNVGSSPIREALSLLTSDALVARTDQRGFRVVEASTDEFDELLKTRIWVEQRALEESILHGDAAWEEEIILATYRLSRVSRSSSKEQFVANDQWETLHKEFHMALISACGSSILLKFCDQLYDRNTRYRHISGLSAYPKREINSEHADLSDAVLSRDTETAVKLLVAHYSTTGKLLRKNVEEHISN
jgi:DNA-binding GntR family transcriptional regulator